MKAKEAYLRAAFQKVIFLFHESGFPIDEIAENIEITCTDIRKSWEGYCQQTISDDYYPEEKYQIVINNSVDNGFNAIEVLIHEVCHAIQYHLYQGNVKPHGKEFKAIAEAVGLTGRMTQTYADTELKIKIVKWDNEIGTYPHKHSVAETLEKWEIVLTFGWIYLLVMIVNYNTN